jgi:hypothetical protein
MALGACTVSQDDQQAQTVRAGEMRTADQEIVDRNVGFKMGQEYPWEVDSSCTAKRDDPKSDGMIEIAPVNASKGDFGKNMEIVFFRRHEDGPMNLKPEDMYSAEIFLDSVAYPRRGNTTASITVTPDAESNYIVYTVRDSSGEFIKALAKADYIEFKEGVGRVGFSMADSTNMFAKIDACLGMPTR